MEEEFIFFVEEEGELGVEEELELPSEGEDGIDADGDGLSTTVVFEEGGDEDNVEGDELPVTVAFDEVGPTVEVVPRPGEGLLEGQPVSYLEIHPITKVNIGNGPSSHIDFSAIGIP